MTVQEIQEYIDRAIETAFAQKLAIDTAEILKKALIDTKGMLDEIDTKKYFEQIDKLIDKEMAQHLVDHMKQALKKEIERNKYVRD